MKIFVYEFMSATWRPGSEVSRAVSLASEGWAMLAASVEDCAAIPGAEVRTVVSAELPRSNDLAVSPIPISLNQEHAAFKSVAQWCDFALIIAPEFDRILETRCRWAEEFGAQLLGPSADVIAVCADKLSLADVWAAASVPSPATKVFEHASNVELPAVVKPRFGAGAMNIRLLTNKDEWLGQQPQQPAVVQPYLPGRDMSMAFLIGARGAIPLRACQQGIRLSNGYLHYTGGRLCEDDDEHRRVREVSQMAINAVVGLRGFVGVDIVLRSSGDMAIEINPRLTTSYLGLRRSCRQNIMDALIRTVVDEPMRVLTWSTNSVSFSV